MVLITDASSHETWCLFKLPNGKCLAKTNTNHVVEGRGRGGPEEMGEDGKETEDVISAASLPLLTEQLWGLAFWASAALLLCH